MTIYISDVQIVAENISIYFGYTNCGSIKYNTNIAFPIIFTICRTSAT